MQQAKEFDVWEFMDETCAGSDVGILSAGTPLTLTATSMDDVEIPNTNLGCKWEVLEARMWGMIKKADAEHVKATKVDEQNKILKETLEAVTQEKCVLEGKVKELEDTITDMTSDLMAFSNEVHILSDILSSIRVLTDTK